MKIQMGHCGINVQFNPLWKRIVDVGPGHNPFKYASHAVEPEPNGRFGYQNRKVRIVEGVEHYFKKLEEGIPEIAADFFDFAYCSHTLEHVENVEAFLVELSRIAQCGFIEVPSWFEELIMPVKEHVNIFWQEKQGRVYYCKKTEVNMPAWDMWHKFYYSNLLIDRKLKAREFVKYRSLNYVPIIWEGNIQVKHKSFPIKW